MEEQKSKYLDEVHLTPDKGVIKKVIQKGTGKKPEKDDEVVVHYRGVLENGTEFDNSYEKDDGFKFIIGADHVIKGWDIGVMDMQIGEKADLVIAPDYAYGHVGNLPKIPGDATLIFTIELLSAHERRPTKWMMNDEERIKATLKLKEDAGIKFKDQNFKEAEGLYREAISHLDAVQNDNVDIKDLRKKILVNIAVVCNKSQSWAETVRACSQSLMIDEDNAKALYLRGVANRKLKQFDEAVADLKNAIKKSPNDKAIRTEFQKCKEEKKNYDKSQQSMFSKFFKEGVYNEKDTEVTTLEDALPKYDPSNPKCFMDIKIGDNDAKRVVFELFKNKVPKTAENFRWLCTGEKSTEQEPLSFKNNIFHRVIKKFMAQGGDITKQNGSGGMSIYGAKFNDEKVWLPHTNEGLLSMANSGPNTNGSQFFITFAKTQWLDGKHIVFGRVVQGMETVLQMEQVEIGSNDKPLSPVTIVDWGEVTDEIPESELDLARYEKVSEQVVPEESKREL